MSKREENAFIGKRTLALLIVVLAMTLSALTGTALAQGNDPATLSVLNDPAATGSTFSAQGCGFLPNNVVNVVVTNTTVMMFFPVPSNASGCVVFTGFTADAGQYTLNAYQSRNSSKQKLMATTTFWVH